MSTQIKYRGGTTTEHSTFTGAERELTIDTTKDTVVIHDGSTVGGFPLAKQSDVDDKLPKSGGAMTGAITTNSTFDGVDIATRDVVLTSTTTTANAALPKSGGAMTGAITTNSTFDGVDIATRDAVLTSTTTTAGAALPKAGGAMTGAITTNSTFDGRDVATDGTKLDGIATSANNYTHPSYNGDDFSVDTTLLSGAVVISDIDINVTTDTSGHVTDANGSYGTRTLTLANLGYSGATNANYITNNNQISNGAGYITSYTDTTYSAGSGLDLSGTTFSVEADLRDGITNIGRDNNDFIAIGTTYHSFYLDGGERARVVNNGDFHADGNVIAYSTTISDERLKENIQPIEDALSKVNQLNGCTFTYTVDGKESAGLIAQDVEKVLPSAVSEKELPLKIDDGKEYKVLQYDQTIGLLVEAIKELTAKVKELESK